MRHAWADLRGVTINRLLAEKNQVTGSASFLSASVMV